MGRPKNAKNKNGYAMSALALQQRIAANLKEGGHSKTLKAILNNMGMSEENQKELEIAQIQIWKDMQTPVALLTKEYAFFRSILDAKMMSGVDPTDKDIMNCMKLLLDISKEVNRLSQLSAKDKVDVLSRNWSDGDIVIDMEK